MSNPQYIEQYLTNTNSMPLPVSPTPTSVVQNNGEGPIDDTCRIKFECCTADGKDVYYEYTTEHLFRKHWLPARVTIKDNTTRMLGPRKIWQWHTREGMAMFFREDQFERLEQLLSFKGIL